MPAPISWYTPTPLWKPPPAVGPAPPVLLGFDDDRFIQTLEETLAQDPKALIDLLITPPTSSAIATTSSTVKLLQPAHGKFYLVAASLVCKRLGLPDKQVTPKQGERMAFVLRRLNPSSETTTRSTSVGCDDRPAAPLRRDRLSEQGWDDRNQSWVALATPNEAAETEARFPLFPVTFAPDRRLAVGWIPVARQADFAPGDPSPLPAFVIRCLFEQPAPTQRNGQSTRRQTLSAPSPPFQMAGFYDPDAPPPLNKKPTRPQP